MKGLYHNTNLILDKYNFLFQNHKKSSKPNSINKSNSKDHDFCEFWFEGCLTKNLITHEPSNVHSWYLSHSIGNWIDFKNISLLFWIDVGTRLKNGQNPCTVYFVDEYIIQFIRYRYRKRI